MQTSTKLTLRLINNFLINNSENTKKLIVDQLQILSDKSLNEVKNHFMFKSLKTYIIDSLRININKRRVKLYNEWYERKITTGLQNYIDSDSNIMQMRNSFNTLILK